MTILPGNRIYGFDLRQPRLASTLLKLTLAGLLAHGLKMLSTGILASPSEAILSVKLTEDLVYLSTEAIWQTTAKTILR